MSGSPGADQGGELFDLIATSGPIAEIVRDLRSMRAGSAPEPSTVLAALLDSGLPDLATSARRRRRLVGSALLVGSTLSIAGLAGGAAAANILPGHSQTVVTRIINNYTPFTIETGHSPLITITLTPGTAPPSAPAESKSTDEAGPPDSRPTSTTGPRPGYGSDSAEREDHQSSPDYPTSSPSRSPEPDDSDSTHPSRTGTPQPTPSPTQPDH